MPAGPRIFAFIALLCASIGCSPEIGDDCETALDCSSQASRLCDRTQPGGYCTIRGCEKGTCPEEAVCVKFRPTTERLAVSYCMFRCSDDGDCREGAGYACLRDEDFGDGNDAELLDDGNKKFCALPPEQLDAGVTSLPDGG
ncbi:MAG: hypothetical protein OXT09_20355 [Myxococcales bacterium]|nr:hypothetical protein [Myxococcales bacterium]